MKISNKTMTEMKRRSDLTNTKYDTRTENRILWERLKKNSLYAK